MSDTSVTLSRPAGKPSRPLRVLFIGNIANNAYNIALLLNDYGIKCDVVCYDYYHVMGCPEWEDAPISIGPTDQFKPEWHKLNLHSFRRPRWFVQGSLNFCVQYLLLRNRNKKFASYFYWLLLSIENGTLSFPFSRSLVKFITVLHRLNPFLFHPLYPLTRSLAFLFRFPILVYCKISVKKELRAKTFNSLFSPLQNLVDRYKNSPEPPELPSNSIDLLALFHKYFPDRPDQLDESDLAPYLYLKKLFSPLFHHYDIVQGFATDPIIPLITNYSPYVAFEHGTLRSHTIGDSAICRLTSLAYRHANSVFITNGDCISYAHHLNLSNYLPMLHPTNDNRISSIVGDPTSLRTQLGCRYVFVCTLRHDWSIKGTDLYIRALPLIQRQLGDNFKVIMTNWGQQVQESRELAERLSVSHLIHWSEPIPRLKLIKLLKSADILFDQMALPHFGATAPEGIACGIPVIMSYDPTSTEWIVDQPAPILPAFTPEDIAFSVQSALDPLWLASYKHQAAEWYFRNHSSAIVLKRHLDVFRNLLS